MNHWVECVPNFSEGRRPEVLESLADAITSVPNVYLLDRESDYSHHRSVFTVVGPGNAVLEAAFAAAKKASELIDLTQHSGEHPRLGATDVIPFVPLGSTPMETCVLLSQQLGQRLWDELKIPVYLYEEAARRPDRQNLADVRRGQFEGLLEEIGTNPDRAPDIGDPVLHPTAGATVVGARWFLIAFNVYLNTPDVAIAKEIAKAIRFSSGGFRFVKAMGFFIEKRQQAQVSMNLINYRGTPLHRVVEFIRREAARFGTSIVATEIVGLVPQEALDMASGYYLQLGDFSSDQILEQRIQKVTRTGGLETRNITSFLQDLASPTPTPGGGSVAALAGSLAGALGSMVTQLTLKNEKYRDVHAALQPHLGVFVETQEGLMRLVQEDASAYEQVLAAFRLPKTTESEITARKEAIEEAFQHAARVPLKTAALALRVLQSLYEAQSQINPNALTDLGVGAQMAVAAGKGALFNVRVNLASLADSDFKRDTTDEAASLKTRFAEIGSTIEAFVESKV